MDRWETRQQPRGRNIARSGGALLGRTVRPIEITTEMILLRQGDPQNTPTTVQYKGLMTQATPSLNHNVHRGLEQTCIERLDLGSSIRGQAKQRCDVLHVILLLKECRMIPANEKVQFVSTGPARIQGETDDNDGFQRTKPLYLVH